MDERNFQATLRHRGNYYGWERLFSDYIDRAYGTDERVWFQIGRDIVAFQYADWYLGN